MIQLREDLAHQSSASGAFDVVMALEGEVCRFLDGRWTLRVACPED